VPSDQAFRTLPPRWSPPSPVDLPCVARRRLPPFALPCAARPYPSVSPAGPSCAPKTAAGGGCPPPCVPGRPPSALGRPPLWQVLPTRLGRAPHLGRIDRGVASSQRPARALLRRAAVPPAMGSVTLLDHHLHPTIDPLTSILVSPSPPLGPSVQHPLPVLPFNSSATSTCRGGVTPFPSTLLPYVVAPGTSYDIPPPLVPPASPSFAVVAACPPSRWPPCPGIFVSFDQAMNRVLRDRVELHPQADRHVPEPIVFLHAAIASLAIEPPLSPCSPSGPVGAPALALSARLVASPPSPSHRLGGRLRILLLHHSHS
jgi:hypothetical protein